jgi:hypothetical protein
VQTNFSLAAVSSDLASWVRGGVGKLRYDETDPSLSADRLFLEYTGTISPTLFAHAVVDYQDDGSSGFDATEAYLEWRPVPRSPVRHRLRFGGFYPRLSLENIGSAWESPFSISSSAINSWLAEEVRLLGAEWSVQRPLGDPGSPHEIGGFAAAFYGNDPIGPLLAWKGWGVHDRQTRWREQIPLPPLPRLEPGGGLSGRQAPWAEPFMEIDHKPGLLLGAEWRYAQRAFVQIAHYDNHADPLAVADGQYGWATRFDQIAVQLSLPWKLGLMAQWMSGYTAMGPIINGARIVDTEFEASYVLLTRMTDGHRITLRYDDFEVVDADFIPMDDNNDAGHATTLAYMYEFSPRFGVGIEWLRVTSNRPAREYAGENALATEEILQAQIRWRFDSSGF